MGKKDKKSKKDDYWDTAFEDDQEAVQPDESAAAPAAAPAAAATPEPESKEATPAPESAEDLFPETTTKKSNGKGGKPAAVADDDESASEKEDSGPTIQIKSKKEKEREKKEKEKLRKKQQMERKKAGGSAAPAPAPAAEKKEEAAAPAPAASSTPAPAPTPAAAGKKGGKADPKTKKKNAMLAALEKQVEAQRAAEAARKQAEEEERRRIEEEERIAAEEERLREEARAQKKEREKAKREELKREGKLLTKKQKEQLAIQQRRAQQLREAGGVTIAGFEEKEGDEDKKSKRPVYGKKKGGKKTAAKTDEEQPSSLASSVADLTLEDKEKEASQAPAEEKEKPAPAAEAPAGDSWEDALKSDAEEDEGESWEKLLESDNEEESNSDSNGSTAKTEVSDVPKAGAKLSNTEQAEVDADELARAEEERKKVERAAEIARVKAEQEQRKKVAGQRRDKKHKAALDARSADNLRSPICCILGHVDTGKTKLLDKIRQTNVQEGEAGGITQQIGATYFPIEAIRQKTAVVNQDEKLEFKVPGLLIIDTPGHESFTNLRTRGSSLCNIAILVIDIMHGLEQQTLESIRLLRDRKTPFIVALNKIDRLYGWEAIPDNGVQDSLAKQPRAVQREFEDRVQKTKIALAEQGLNSELYYKNRNLGRNVSLVPTSAVTGEGVPDMLKLLIELTQNRMSEKLMYLSELECTVLEVKVIEGLGTTIDVVLSNGVLREGDRIVLCGMNGPIATNVRALLTPQPLREMRIKSAYVHHKEVKAALGVKIAANDLEKAIAGSRLLLVGPDDDEEDLMDEVMSDLTDLQKNLDKSGKGVSVQASTLGSLEALLDFLKQMKIPVMSISIGPVYKRDVMKATTMLEKAKEFAVMLCFDVKIDKEAEEYAEQQGIRIFSADIIYHLFDAFTNYQKELLEVKRKETAAQAVFPCVLHTIKVINKRNPMIIGVDVVDGSLRVGTPIAVVKIDPATQMRQVMTLGRVVSLEVNHKSVDIVKKGQAQGGVAMRLDSPANQPTWGRHVDESDIMYSEITRDSINTLKDAAYRDDVTRDEWLLLRQLKSVFNIA
ncbi:fun12p [Myxozyma melibiosi]|uniref:Eukaryotic translation initiation factor 5B n=1 Tax=Myxozyma melibiosi TaxID=54550 RepID=A0ABR1F5N5_9ASCO